MLFHAAVPALGAPPATVAEQTLMYVDFETLSKIVRLTHDPRRSSLRRVAFMDTILGVWTAQVVYRAVQSLIFAGLWRGGAWQAIKV